ncbi:hypothetical protein Tco_0445923 [Tanacetum coccineum]
MKWLFFTLNIPTKSTSELSLILSQNAISWRHSQEHPLNIKEYLMEFWYTAKVVEDSNRVWFSIPTRSIKGEVRGTSFRNSIRTSYMAHSRNYEAVPTIQIVREWFPFIGYNAPSRRVCFLLGGSLAFQALHTSTYNKKKVSQGKKFGAKTRHRKKPTSLKHHPMSKIEATKASIIVQSESALGHDASADSTAEADLGKSAPNDLLSQQQDAFETSLDLSISDDATKKIKLEDLSKLVKDMDVDFMDLDSLEDDKPIIKLEKEKADTEAEAALLKAQLSFPNVEQLTELLISDINREIKDLRKYIEGMEIKILRDLKVQMSKLKTLDALPSLLLRVLKPWTDLLKLLNQHQLKLEIMVFLQQTKLELTKLKGRRTLNNLQNTSSKLEGEPVKNKGKEAMSHEETGEKEFESYSDAKIKMIGSRVESSKKKRIKKFAYSIEGGETVSLTEEQVNEQKKIEQSVKDDLAKKEVELGREELVDLLGINVVTNMYKAQMKYDKYCEKMLKRRALGKIINYDVFSKGKGPITLKVYPKRTGAGWTTIHSQIQTRMENLYKTKHKLEIDFNNPLGEQDPIIKANDLARRKRKHADDIHDYFSTFNSHQRQDFVSIEDFGDFTNEMLYTLQEIFFRLHQGPGQDDHARTFSSFLLAKVYKRNKNPLKQIRDIEHLRH